MTVTASLWLALTALAVSAQTPSSDGGAGDPHIGQASMSTSGKAAAQEPEELEPEGLEYLPRADGARIPVPAGATWEEFQEWLRSRQGEDYSVTSLTLVGTADEERALLTATIQVQINRENEWVRVPLNLNEAVLADAPRYQGAGEASFAGSERQAGYRWWFRGKGRHELTLSLIVPIRKQVLPTRRIQLAVPPAAVSSLKMGIPIERVSTKVLPDTAWVKTRPQGESGSEIEVSGLGTRLDLSWQPLPDVQRVETVLETETALSADLSGDSIVLDVKQTIRALQGSFEEVSVRLPAGFNLLNVDERSGKLYDGHSLVADNPNHVTIELAEPTTGPIHLNWTLESEFSRDDGPLTLEGFEVDRARLQTGQVVVTSNESYRVTKRGDKGGIIHRSNVQGGNAGRQSGEGRILGAYRFLKQPFRLVLDVQEIEPYLTVEPHLKLHVSAEQAELDALFQFEVPPDRGSVQEIELKWPGRRREGWEIDSLESHPSVEQVYFEQQSDNQQSNGGGGAPEDEADDGSIHIRLVSRKSGRFDLPFKARRPIAAGEKEFPISLPRAVASSLPQTLLVVVCDENVEADLVPGEGTVARSLPHQSGMPPHTGMAEESRQPRELKFHIDSPAHTFLAEVAVHEQLVQAETTAVCELAVGELRENRLLVTQTIFYDVAYEGLSQARLLVPRQLEEQVRFSTTDGESLTPTWTGREEGSLNEVRLALSQPRLGRFGVTARFVIDLPDNLLTDEKTTADLPLIHSSDAEYTSTRLEFRDHERIDVVVDDNAWLRRLTVEETTEWSTAEAPAEIPLKLTPARLHLSRDFSVRQALIRTTFDENGYARSRAQYRIEGPVSTLVLRFPQKVAPEAFWWNRQRLGVDRITEQAPETGEYRLELPEALDAEDHLLTVDFHSQVASPFGWSGVHRLSAPGLPPHVWVEQTVWEVVLPFQQHLFTQPPGFTPQFRWERQTLLWSRIPSPPYANPETWISAEDGPLERADFSQGNVYHFSRFGPTTSLPFSSMSRSLIVLMGAGLALALGFVLLKIPATRSVVTFLTLAFTVAVVGLWHPGPVQLLLQPALLGLLLATAAVLIESSLRQERGPAVLTLSSSSDYAGSSRSSSSIDQHAAIGIGSEEPTAVRHAPAPVREPISSAEVRSHR